MVTNPDTKTGTLANGYTYASPQSEPTVTAISPNSGTTNGGTSVTIAGRGSWQLIGEIGRDVSNDSYRRYTTSIIPRPRPTPLEPLAS